MFTSYKVRYRNVLCFFKSYLSVSKFVFSTLAQAEGFLLPPKVIVILYILPGFRVFFFPRAAGIFGVGWELACKAGAWRLWAQERTGAREGDTRGERERLPERSMKIVSSPPILTTWPVLRDLSKILKEND